jgi:hypothetical protein
MAARGGGPMRAGATPRPFRFARARALRWARRRLREELLFPNHADLINIKSVGTPFAAGRGIYLTNDCRFSHFGSGIPDKLTSCKAPVSWAK